MMNDSTAGLRYGYASAVFRQLERNAREERVREFFLTDFPAMMREEYDDWDGELPGVYYLLMKIVEEELGYQVQDDDDEDVGEDDDGEDE